MPKLSNSVIGVDLGRYALKGVLLQRRGGKVALTNYAVHVRTDGGSESSESLAGELKSLFQKMGGRALACSVGVSRADSILRIIEQPQTPPEILREAVRLNGMTLLNKEVKDFVLDCDLIVPVASNGVPQPSQQGGTRKYLVGGLPRMGVTQIAEAFQQSRGTLDAVQLAPICLFNAFEFARGENFANEAFVLVDIGHGSSTVTVGVKKELVLVRSIDYGGRVLMESLAGGGSMAEPQAVLDMLDRGDETLVYNARNSLSVLTREIGSSIGFFEGRHEETIARIFVSGGAVRESILTILTEELQIPCEKWNPFENCEMALHAKAQEEFARELPSLTVACGAAAELLKA